MQKKKRSNKTNPYVSKVQEFLKKKKGKSYKRKEISRSLQVSKSDYHLFREAVEQLLREGKIMRLKGGKLTSSVSLQRFQGEIQMTRKGFAFVTDERTGEDVFISAGNLNTALDGDLVEVQLFGVSRGRNKEGQVLRIISRANHTFVGTYHKSEYYGFVVPDNPKVYRDFFIPEEKSKKAKNGQKVVVRMEKWDSSQLNPEGSIIEILGYPDEPGVDVSSVAISFGLPLSFPKKVEQEAAQLKLEITPETLKDRLDLRDQQIFTIDPPDAKDFDDAVSLEKLPNGNYLLGVHIADVSHFVKPGSAIDKEALRRATSVYLVDRVIPMLPEHLSNNLCSLQPHVDRLTYTCQMEMDARGNVIKHHIQPSVINSKRRFTYLEAQEIIDDPGSRDKFAPVLREMHALSQRLRKRRFQNGSIDFNTPEVKFKLDERGFPIDIIPVEPLDTHKMIEEFMLMANQTVTMHVHQISKGKRTLPFIYRVHEKPDREKLQKFTDFMKALGYQVNLKRNFTPMDFQQLLTQVEGKRDEPLVKEVAMRTMMKAVYSLNNAGHFGLAFQLYTHFTSPIRRYPDLEVHRLLKLYQKPVQGAELQSLMKRLQKVCEIASQQGRSAMSAERESVKIKQVEWLEKHQDQVFQGIISGVTSFGLFVETMPYLIEGLVRMEMLEDDFYIFNEKTYSLTGKDSGRVLRLGDPVRVRVANINRERNEIDFQLVIEDDD